MDNLYRCMPEHAQARAAKKIDVTNRLCCGTEYVYLDAEATRAADRAAFDAAFGGQEHTDTGRKVYFGEMHGHTVLSDGSIDPDVYYENLAQRVDFGALTDHDHGGVGKDTLYTEKWAQIQELAKKYYRPGQFTTLLAYERDSYPWYDNQAVYFDSHDAQMLPGAFKGKTTAQELAEWLKRKDVFLAPHDTVRLTCSTDFTRRAAELMPNGFEIYSRGDCAEYFDHPLNVFSSVRGGSLQEALAAGAHPAVYAGSDDHDGNNATDIPEMGFPCRYPGMTAVWARSNTAEGIFEALKNRHTYAFMGPERIYIDFRVNDQLMGSCMMESASAPHREIFYSVSSAVPVAKITVVKNNEDYFVARREGNPTGEFVDYERMLVEDWYYLRVELQDGRMAWTSPCWVKAV